MLAELKSQYEKNPDCIETNRAIAEYYLEEGEFEEAEPYLTRILELDEQIAPVHNQLGAIYLKKSQYEKAEYHFKRALQLDFDLAEAHFNLGYLYQTQGKFDRALPYYKEAVNANPDDAQIYCLMGQCAQCIGMMEEAEAFFAESFRISPMTEAAIHLSTIYISEERYSEAEEILNFLIAMMDEINDSKRDKDEADASLSPDLSWRMDRESLQYTLGLVYKKQEKYIPAMKHLRDVVMMNEQNEEAFNYLGECCADFEREKEAESFFIHANKLNPHFMKPVVNLGKLYYRQERYGRSAAAMEYCVKLINEQALVQEQDLQIELVYELLGMSYMQMGNREKAVEIWNMSLDMNPDQPRIVSLINGSHEQTYKKTTLSIDD